MNSVNIVKKLTSRKFWAMLIGLITNTLIVYNFPDNQIAQICAVIGSIGTIVSYIFAEASVDAESVKTSVVTASEADPPVTPAEVINNVSN